MVAWSGDRYDALSGPQSGWGSAVVARLDQRGLGTVLDAGCGSGRVTETLLRAAPEARVVALDASASMLAAARQRLAPFTGRVDFVRADLERALAPACAPWAPFDAVFSTGTFHWVRDHGRLYGALHELLVPGGQLVAQFGGAGSVAAVREQLAVLGIDSTPLNRYADDRDTRRWCHEAGFVDVETWMHDEPVTFDRRDALVDYLDAAVISPYLAERPAPDRRAVAESVADGLGELVLRFVRTNVTARRTQSRTRNV